MRSVLASRNQELYTFTARDVSDIADRLGSHHVEALSSSDGTYQFWVTPTMSGRRLNGPATKLALHRWGCRADRRVIAGVGVEVFR